MSRDPTANHRADRELLAALKEMLAAHSNENIGVNASLRRIKAKEQARAAIAKAESRTHPGMTGE